MVAACCFCFQLFEKTAMHYGKQTERPQRCDALRAPSFKRNFLQNKIPIVIVKAEDGLYV